MTPRFKGLGAVLALVTALAAAGCQDAATEAADCQGQIQVDGATFTSYGSAQRDATAHGTADQAECDDTGQNPAGSVFPDDPQQVETWRFAGYPPAEVLGVRSGGDGFEVYVADSLPDDERDRILEELSRP